MDMNSIRKQSKVMGDECLAFRVRALNRVITNLYDEALGPYGITVNQATMLIMLTMVEEATPGRIGQVLIMEKSTISRNLERMKKQGWVETSTREGSGKEQLVRVTAAGREMLAAFHPGWEEAQTKAAELLNEKGVSAVHTLHEAVRKKHPI